MYSALLLSPSLSPVKHFTASHQISDRMRNRCKAHRPGRLRYTTTSLNLLPSFSTAVGELRSIDGAERFRTWSDGTAFQPVCVMRCRGRFISSSHLQPWTLFTTPSHVPASRIRRAAACKPGLAASAAWLGHTIRRKVRSPSASLSITSLTVFTNHQLQDVVCMYDAASPTVLIQIQVLREHTRQPTDAQLDTSPRTPAASSFAVHTPFRAAPAG